MGRGEVAAVAAIAKDVVRMNDYAEVYDGKFQCPNGAHDFELMPVPGGMGIVLGESRCRTCGALANDEVMVDGGPHADRRTGNGWRWGRWRFNPCTHELEFHEIPGRVIYEIDLDQMRSPAECLDAIYQVAFKSWMTVQDRSDLLEAIRDMAHPQALRAVRSARKTSALTLMWDLYE